MSAVRDESPVKVRPRLLFVDDERRVLNSMRAMFRRDYELFLTTRGDEAVEIVRSQSIDVVVADQRMPIMSGVEVLSAIKELSPATVRILLTGYADPGAIEAAMNEGEVFRFLSKPCAAKELRGTISLAAGIAADSAIDRETAVHVPEADGQRANGSDWIDLGLDAAVELGWQASRQVAGTAAALNGKSFANHISAMQAEMTGAQVNGSQDAHADDRYPFDESKAKKSLDDTDTLEIVMAGESYTVVDHSKGETSPENPDPPAVPPTLDLSKVPGPNGTAVRVGTGKYNVCVMVYSDDDAFARSVGEAMSDIFHTFHASNIRQLTDGIARYAPPVLITDISTDPQRIQTLTASLKRSLPEMVTMVASPYRDANVMVRLINHAQVFRIVDKPLGREACQKHIRDALKLHIRMLKSPALARRFKVRSSDEAPPGAWSRSLLSLSRGLVRVRSLWALRRQ